jgi:two-component system, NtrC family, nitrogen regulation sensor histidine kinase NtrY
MQKSSILRYLNSIVVTLIALIISGFFFHNRIERTDSAQIAAGFQEKLIEQEKLLRQSLQEFHENYTSSEGKCIKDPKCINELENLYQKEGIILFLYEHNRLKFWSHNAIPFEQYQPPGTKSGIVKQRNGLYLYNVLKSENQDYVGYMIIKNEFRYQNNFLINQFHEKLPPVESLFFISDRSNEGYPIYDTESNYLFSLGVRSEDALITVKTSYYIISLLFAIGALLIFIYFTFRYFSVLFKGRKLTVAIGGFLANILIIRLLMVYFNFPGVFYDGYMFAPELYATSAFLPSLGDLLLNVAFVTIIGYFLYHNFTVSSLKRHVKLKVPALGAAAMFIMIYLFCGLSLYLIEGLVINSHLNLDVNFIFNLDIYSLVGFLIIGLIFFAFFFFSVVLCRLATNILQTSYKYWLVCLITYTILIAVTWFIYGYKPLLWMLTFAAILVFEFDSRIKTPAKGFSALVISIFLFSLVSTFALYRFNTIKDFEKRKTLALQLASERDPVAEFLFKEIEDALFKDNQLQNLVRNDPYNETAIYNYLQHHYFFDFWAKYELQVTVCRPDEMLLIKPANIEVICAKYFEEYIQNYGKQSNSENFIYLDNNTGRNSYIARLSTHHAGGEEHFPEYHIYLEFDAKYIARDMGFPELLIDDAIDINRELINYSYATYKNGVLVNEYGPFVYNMDAGVYSHYNDEFSIFEFDNYSHVMFRKDEDTTIVISRPESTFLEAVAPFSYLFITFFVLVAIFWLLVNRTKPSHLLRMNFMRRVQYSMIIILLLSALSIGGASAFFIFNVYENKNLAFLNEKTHSVLREIEQTLANEYFLDHTYQNYLYDLLLQYSNVFFTDINLYSIDGILIASSRPKVFEEGLVGNNMNALAFHKMHNERNSQFIHTEHIGRLEYLSAYTPLYNRYQEKLAYLNLPYFAKQSELRNEMSYFLVAFINIYLFLVLMAVLLALFVSGYVTKPMQLIREKLARIQLGKTNEKIVWNRDDEIGSLVSEYNRMVDELSISADLLARSERETAWREMARQVAHEIKNPLTPMKLSVQYLEKAWNEKVPDWDQRLERFSKTMIEQIDNMATIAREFSDFAQMPAGKNYRIDLKTFVPEAMDLYKDFEHVDIQLQMQETDGPMLVSADRQQLLRVFNNLAKNSIQAYGKNETAVIDVVCRRAKDEYIISFRDYGCGIPADLQQNIFNPYFTTKAKGMGLGLSMVKNIIESINGRIRFSSREGQGSTFEITIPAVGQ